MLHQQRHCMLMHSYWLATAISHWLATAISYCQLQPSVQSVLMTACTTLLLNVCSTGQPILPVRAIVYTIACLDDKCRRSTLIFLTLCGAQSLRRMKDLLCKGDDDLHRGHKNLIA